MDTHEPQELDSLLRLAPALYTYTPEEAERKTLRLLVLEGHLAIEEQLNAILKKSLAYPKALEDGRFTFAQRLCLTKALKYQPENSWVWNGIEKLNKVRNDLSHGLQPPKLEVHLKDFLEYVASHTPSSLKGTNDKNTIQQLRTVFSFLTGYLDGFENEGR